MLIKERTDTMIFVGIDVASKKHDCFLMQDETGLIYSKPFSIDNNEEGYKKTPHSYNKLCGAN